MVSERASELRITVAVAQLLRVFLDDVTQPRYGYDLMRVTGFPSGKLYPILGRLTSAGWLEREREDAEAAEKGRPVRFTYILTERGIEAARYQLALLSDQISLPPLQRQLRPGELRA